MYIRRWITDNGNNAIIEKWNNYLRLPRSENARDETRNESENECEGALRLQTRCHARWTERSKIKRLILAQMCGSIRVRGNMPDVSRNVYATSHAEERVRVFSSSRMRERPDALAGWVIAGEKDRFPLPRSLAECSLSLFLSLALSLFGKHPSEMRRVRLCHNACVC